MQNQNRRAFLEIAASSLLPVGLSTQTPESAASQKAAPPSAQELISKKLDELGGKHLAVSKLVYPPGASSMAHRHPAFIMAYVVSGHVESALDDEKSVVYGPNDESHMQLHRTFRNPSSTEPFTVIVFSVRDAV